ncbi:germin-like protein 9-3 [Tanacetum coccineum]
MAGDPDILSDFILPPVLFGPLDGNFFTYTGMRALVNAPFPKTFKVTKAAMTDFPALNGQSVSYAVLQFPNSTTLQKGDIFLFPKGLVYFQFNSDAQNPALALSAFGSANARTVSVPNSFLIQLSMIKYWLCPSKPSSVPTITKIKYGLSS